ncbi:MAG: H4MPT-linked C1 transfer pathway protein [ANME-2 cluster archaeon]|nr:H4MPT-linked C1 transfer pathway protein [ANME-2 cluster archaeon]
MNKEAPVIGIDIGGANTKLAFADRSIVELHYIPLWKDTQLPQALQDMARRFKPGKVGVVITGELADCFPDKEQGVRFIVDAVDAAFPGAMYLDHHGLFSNSSNISDIRSLAAANWMASALLAGRDIDCIFVDAGSTTTDLIPVKNGRPLAGDTDLKRLGRHELLYRGMLRTNIAAFMNRIELGGVQYRVASELFAQTGDAYVLLGCVRPEDYTCDTPDGEGKTPKSAARRLARVVCADTTELQHEDIMNIARQIYLHQRDELSEALELLSKQHGIKKVVGAGLGELLIQDAARHAGLGSTLLSRKYGPDISKVFPAFAVACLLSEYDTSSQLSY